MVRTQKHSLDKFYTKGEVAQACIGLLDLSEFDLVVEPSAGSGSFSNRIEGCLAYDLAPEDDSIIEADWFTVRLPRDKKKILIVGNPPFGRQNSLALAFIRHATDQAVEAIAFILPRSFKKDGVQNSIDRRYHLELEVDLDPAAFLLDGEDYLVPCVFQIWRKKTELRPKPTKYLPEGFRFVEKTDSPDLSFRRVGGTAGTVSQDWESKSPASHYFISMEPGYSVDALEQAIVDLPHATRNHSVGPRSISRNELLRELFAAGHFSKIAA